MEPINIQCTECQTTMRLSETLLARVSGRAGKISCRGCGQRIRIDAHGNGLLFEGALLESEAPSASSAAALLSESSSPSLPVSVTAFSTLPPPQVESSPAEAGSSERAPSLPPSFREEQTTLSPTTVDGRHDDPVSALPLAAESAPYQDELPPESVEEIYGQIQTPRSVRSGRMAPPPPRPHLSKAPSMPPAPPRPWELSRAPSPVPQAPSPFDDAFGLSVPPPMLETVRLTTDGRLVNASDDGTITRRSSRKRVAGFAAAAVTLLTIGAAASQPEVVGAAVSDVASAVLPRRAPTQLGKIAHVVVQKGDGAPVQAAAAQPVAVAEPAGETSAEETVAEESVAPVEAPDHEVAVVSSVSTVSPARHTSDSGSKSDEAEVAGASEEQATASDEASSEAEGVVSSVDPPESSESADADEAAPVLPPFDRDAASVALNEATAQATSCRKPEDPSGLARVVVSFAPSGRATRATVSGPPFAGTETGGCIAARFRSARIPAFSGDMVTVSKTVVVR